MSEQQTNTEGGEIDENIPAMSAGAENDENTADKTAAEAASAENTAAGQDSAENAGQQGDDLPDTVLLAKKVVELEAKSTDLAAQLADSRDQLLRKAADVENFRKRMNQEKQNAIEFANRSLLLDIIPIMDDFERAIQSASASAELAELPAGKAMMDGLTMIEKRLASQLEGKWGLKRFNSAGEPFDPNRHEAMIMEKSPDITEPVVQEEFQKGYMLKDRVIRAAQVKVLMPEGE
jgi:molecular chaperone GrpE